MSIVLIKIMGQGAERFWVARVREVVAVDIMVESRWGNDS